MNEIVFTQENKIRLSSYHEIEVQCLIPVLMYCTILYNRFVEKGNLEVQLFILTSKHRANHQKPYVPPEGYSMYDINVVS